MKGRANICALDQLLVKYTIKLKYNKPVETKGEKLLLPWVQPTVVQTGDLRL